MKQLVLLLSTFFNSYLLVRVDQQRQQVFQHPPVLSPCKVSLNNHVLVKKKKKIITSNLQRGVLSGVQVWVSPGATRETVSYLCER